MVPIYMRIGGMTELDDRVRCGMLVQNMVIIENAPYLEISQLGCWIKNNDQEFRKHILDSTRHRICWLSSAMGGEVLLYFWEPISCGGTGPPGAEIEYAVLINSNFTQTRYEDNTNYTNAIGAIGAIGP